MFSRKFCFTRINKLKRCALLDHSLVIKRGLFNSKRSSNLLQEKAILSKTNLLDKEIGKNNACRDKRAVSQNLAIADQDMERKETIEFANSADIGDKKCIPKGASDVLVGINFKTLDKFSSFHQIYLMQHMEHLRKSNGLVIPISERSSVSMKEEDRQFFMEMKLNLTKLRQSQRLTCFTQVCIDSGNRSLLNTYIFNPKKSICLKEAATYTIYLRDMYDRHDFCDLPFICDEIWAMHIRLDVDAFAILFQCLGKCKNYDKAVDMTHNFLYLMDLYNISICQLFEDGCFPNCDDADARNALLRAHVTLPDTRPKLRTDRSKNRYDNVLLNSLNSQLFRSHAESIMHNILSTEELIKGLNDQIEMEKACRISVDSVLPDSYMKKIKSCEEELQNYEVTWERQLRDALRSNIKSMNESAGDSEFRLFSLVPFLETLKEDVIINVMLELLESLRSFTASYSPSFMQLSCDVGSLLFSKYEREANQEFEVAMTAACIKLYKSYDTVSSSGSNHPSTVFEEALLEKNSLKYLKKSKKYWPKQIQQKIGDLLLNMAVNNLTIDTVINNEKIKKAAFQKVLRKREKNCFQYEIWPCLEVLKHNGISQRFLVGSHSLPMLCPPVPWITYEMGAHVLGTGRILKNEASPKQICYAENNPQEIRPILDGLTELGAVPWKVNKPILDVVIQLFKNGGCQKLKIMEDPETFTANTKETPQHSNHFDSVSTMSLRNKEQYNNYSLWAEAVYKISIANRYRDRVFWLPLSLDFRGRAYTISNHLSHLNSDVYRSFLIFAKGKKLGPKGLRWLKIHVANLTGLVKTLSLDDRLKFCDEHLHDIFNSADNPLDGDQWWAEADDQWQCLAACMELTNALRSGSPEDFVSHLPIHQDGSCNGLQHYAALGRDTIGALAVNVKPSDLPQDVYRTVLDIVIRKLKIDSEKGHRIAQKLLPIVGRKTIKQTIMTSVYGVTTFGAAKQVEKQLKGITGEDFHHCDQHYASKYLANAALSALNEMFNSAKYIQNWLGNYSDYISKVYDEEVSWKTPLGFLVYQPYLSTNSTIDKYSFKKIDVRKQGNGFAPNFIHSLDASHMFLTAIYCANKGITFASIHDCFWTHATDIDELNEICREQFVRMYSLPLLDDLKKFYDQRYPIRSEEISRKLQVPNKGEFDINEVKSSTFFFS